MTDSNDPKERFREALAKKKATVRAKLGLWIQINEFFRQRLLPSILGLIHLGRPANSHNA